MPIPTQTPVPTLAPTPTLTRLQNSLLRTTPTPEPIITPTPKEISFGDTVRVRNLDGLEVTFTKWGEHDSNIKQYASAYYTFQTIHGMKFISIWYRFTNAGNREIRTPYWGPDRGELLTSPDQYYYKIWGAPVDIHAPRYIPSASSDYEISVLPGMSGGFNTLLPGQSIEGSIVFEIPNNAMPVTATIPNIDEIISFK